MRLKRLPNKLPYRLPYTEPTPLRRLWVETLFSNRKEGAEGMGAVDSSGSEDAMNGKVMVVDEMGDVEEARS